MRCDFIIFPTCEFEMLRVAYPQPEALPKWLQAPSGRISGSGGNASVASVLLALCLSATTEVWRSNSDTSGRGCLIFMDKSKGGSLKAGTLALWGRQEGVHVPVWCVRVGRFYLWEP